MGKRWLLKEEYEKLKEGKNDSISISNYNVNKKVILYFSVHHGTSEISVSSSNNLELMKSSSFLPKALTNNRLAIISKDCWLADSGADTMLYGRPN
ncbi:hypothetical protein HI914_03122 [Erysiphe necator]|nr:hypothetical protein HI914_03122 [Erysiphe necator]